MPDGAVLRLTTTGSGQPLVLCHGGPGLWDYLGPLARLVADMALVYRYDQRGCGLSTGDGPFTVARFVADLETLRQALGHEVSWVGGHSWGAKLALRHALAYPGRVRGVLYVCGTGIGHGFRGAYRAEMRRRLADDFPRWSTCAANATAPMPRSVSSACCNGGPITRPALMRRGWRQRCGTLVGG